LASWPTVPFRELEKLSHNVFVEKVFKKAVKVILAGTVHLDQDASACLYSLADSIAPACIAVEISPFSIRYRSGMERIWLRHFMEVMKYLPVVARKHIKLELLRRQISMPFEWSVAEKYALVHGIYSVPVDSGSLSRSELPKWKEELLSRENMRFLCSLEDETADAYFSHHYKKAIKILKNPEIFSGLHRQLVFDKNWCKREKVLARRVANLARRFSPLLYIGGWMHLIRFSVPVTLASILQIDRIDRFLVTRQEAVKI